MILLVAPSPGELTSGGYLYNEYIASRLPKERFDYRFVDAPEQLYRLPEQLKLGQGDSVLVDSLFFHHPAAVERLAGSFGGHLWMLIHCLPSSDPTLPKREIDEWKARERRCLSFCEGAVVTGKATEHALNGKKLLNGPCTVAAPGLDRRLFFSEQGRGKPSPGDVLQLLTVANWTSLKNHAAMLPVLSDVFSSVEYVREGKGWLWSIIGKCDEEGELCGSFMRKAEEMGIRGKIELLATQPVEEVARLTRSADIFLHPSLMESYGMSIAEAMASGCVVIAGRNQGTAELIRDGEDGILCDTHDYKEWRNALHRLMSSPEEYRRMSEAAVRSADVLPSWEDTAQILLQAVEGSKAR